MDWDTERMLWRRFAMWYPWYWWPMVGGHLQDTLKHTQDIVLPLAVVNECNKDAWI